MVAAWVCIFSLDDIILLGFGHHRVGRCGLLGFEHHHDVERLPMYAASQGYALVEFSSKTEAQDAIKGMNGQEILTQPVNVTWAFGSGPCRKVRN